MKYELEMDQEEYRRLVINIGGVEGLEKIERQLVILAEENGHTLRLSPKDWKPKEGE